jgi:hypothetical protein
VKEDAIYGEKGRGRRFASICLLLSNAKENTGVLTFQE